MQFTFGSGTQSKTSISFLKYTTKSGGSKSAKDKAQDALLSKLNNMAKNGWEKQSQMIMGLALHTVQDYFAHCVEVDVVRTKINYTTFGIVHVKENYIRIPMHKVDDSDMMNISPSKFEDNIDIFKWRYETAKDLTKTIYWNFWLKNREMKTLTVTQEGDWLIYNFNLLSVTEFWTVYGKRYYYHWS